MSKERLGEVYNNVGRSIHDDEHVLLREVDYDWLTEQAERVQELEQNVREWGEIVNEQWEQINTQIAEKIKRYREALEFYANENNYEIWNSMAVRSTEINRDKGYKARKALEDENE